MTIPLALILVLGMASIGTAGQLTINWSSPGSDPTSVNLSVSTGNGAPGVSARATYSNAASNSSGTMIASTNVPGGVDISSVATGGAGDCSAQVRVDQTPGGYYTLNTLQATGMDGFQFSQASHSEPGNPSWSIIGGQTFTITNVHGLAIVSSETTGQSDHVRASFTGNVYGDVAGATEGGYYMENGYGLGFDVEGTDGSTLGELTTDYSVVTGIVNNERLIGEAVTSAQGSWGADINSGNSYTNNEFIVFGP